MNIYKWRILVGTARVLAAYGIVFIALYVISVFDEQVNRLLWQPLFRRDFIFAGFAVCVVFFYCIGWFSETRAGNWFDKNVLTRIPYVGRLIITLNPQVRELIANSKGALEIPFFQEGWRVALLTAVHPTKEGCMGTIGFIGLPPIQEQIDQNTRVKVREIGKGTAAKYELIPTEIALKQEFTYGTSVPPNAYQDLVTMTFGNFVRIKNLLPPS